MSTPALLLSDKTLFSNLLSKSAPFLLGLGAVAGGFIAGSVIVGPSLSRPNPELAAANAERFAAWKLDVSAPDPFPYRTPTPQFDNGGPPAYGAQARSAAKSRVASRTSEPEISSQRIMRTSHDPGPPAIAREASQAYAYAPQYAAPSASVSNSSPAPKFDRHTIY